MKKILLAIIFSAVSIEASEQATKLKRIVLVVKYLSRIAGEQQGQQMIEAVSKNMRSPGILQQTLRQSQRQDPFQTIMATPRRTAPPEPETKQVSLDETMAMQGGRIMPLSKVKPTETFTILKQQDTEPTFKAKSIKELRVTQRSPKTVTLRRIAAPELETKRASLDTMAMQGGRVMLLSEVNPHEAFTILKQQDEKGETATKKRLPVSAAWESPKSQSAKKVTFVESNGLQPATCPLNVVVVSVLTQSEHKWPKGDVVPGLSWEAVACGEGGHCGYHALKNVVGLMEILVQTPPGEALDTRALEGFDVYRDFMQAATPIIKRLRVDLSWLDGDALEKLRDSINCPWPILIVENVPVKGLEFHENILLAVQKFAQNSNDTLGFVWNSGLRDRLRVMGGIHWVGFVAVKKAGCITLYCMDSGGGRAAMYIKNVIKLLSLTPEQIDEILEKEHIKHMMQDLRMMQINFENYSLADIVDRMLNGWQYPTIPLEIQQQLLTLLIIHWPAASEDDKTLLKDVYWEAVLNRLKDVDKSDLIQLVFPR